MAAAGLGDDLLLANEVVDPTPARRAGRAADDVTRHGRRRLAGDDRRRGARRASRDVLIDVDIGLPRCGCAPDDAGRLADLARVAGLDVRGVMGYEGHLMVVADRDAQRAQGRARRSSCCSAPTPTSAARSSPPAAPGTYDLHDRWRHRGAGRQLRADGHGLRAARPAVRPGVHDRRHGDLRSTRATPWPTSA